jgi:hypothetical protein
MADPIEQVITGVPFAQNGTNPEVQPASSAIESAILSWLMPSRHAISPHWSRVRDQELRALWKTVDPFKVAVNTFVSKAVTIPIRIHPRDKSVIRHSRQAAEFQQRLLYYSGLMRGWKKEFRKYAIDWCTQDNGAFMLVLGKGVATQPIIGAPYGVLHLDAKNCQRTGDPTYPVIYTHSDGKRYRLHYTRLIYSSNLPDPDADLFDVGHCPITVALDSGIEMRDIYTYMQEKLGSRPKRQIIFAKTGTTRDKLVEAFEFADDKMDSEGLKRFSKTVMLAPKNPNGNLDLGMIDMAQTPDQFDRKDTSLIDISHIAAAFGLSLQDMAVNYGISVGSMQTNEVQERMGRGKGVGAFLEDTEDQINQKFLPSHLFALFDNQDDQQDEQQSEIWDRRSTARQRDLTTGSTTVQVERSRMLRTGEITEDEYASMELLDGRLPNGASVIALFFSRDKMYQTFLDFGVENVTNPEDNEPTDAILKEIDLRERAAYEALEVAPTQKITRKLFEILAALGHLRALYDGYEEEKELLRVEEEMRAAEAGDMALDAQEEGAEALNEASV